MTASQGQPLSFTDQITYVHEFTHALQDQYFDLNTLLSPQVEDNPDQALAVTSLVEGDATASMTLYMQACRGARIRSRCWGCWSRGCRRAI